jgi:hypothetical protein
MANGAYSVLMARSVPYLNAMLQLLYFTCRLSMILHILFFAWNMNTAQEIPCQLVVTVSKGMESDDHREFMPNSDQ